MRPGNVRCMDCRCDGTTCPGETREQQAAWHEQCKPRGIGIGHGTAYRRKVEPDTAALELADAAPLPTAIKRLAAVDLAKLERRIRYAEADAALMVHLYGSN